MPVRSEQGGVVLLADTSKSLRPLIFVHSLSRFIQISFYENKAQYQKTRLGLLWIPFSTLLFVFVLVAVFANMQGLQAVDHYLYVLSGYCLWLLILEVINQSTLIIQTQIDFANHNRMSIPELYFKNLLDRLFRHLLNMGVLYASMIILAFMGLASWWSIAQSFLLYPAVLLLSLVAGYAMSILINIVCIFWPDVEKVIQTSTRFLFFLSPVFWVYHHGEGGFRYFLINGNPVTYWLDIMRQAFGIAPLDLRPWLICAGICVVLCLMAYVVYRQTSNIVRNIS